MYNLPLKLYIIGLPHDDIIIPEDSEKFLVTHTRQFSLVHTDDLSITSFETYTKDKPQVLAQNNEAINDTEQNYNANLSMYPVMSNTNDDNIDDVYDVDDYASCTQCISDHDHPSTCVPSSYQQQHTSGKINCCHPTKYSRKH